MDTATIVSGDSAIPVCCMNFLEQLTAEWYAYRGSFVRTNVKFGRLGHGGWKGEIDVAAYDPKSKTFVHIETSWDAYSWEKRKQRFVRKFRDAADHYDSIFPVEKKTIERIAIVGFANMKTVTLPDSIRLVSVSDFIKEILHVLKAKHPLKDIVHEGYPLLRALQFAAACVR